MVYHLIPLNTTITCNGAILASTSVPSTLASTSISATLTSTRVLPTLATAPICRASSFSSSGRHRRRRRRMLCLQLINLNLSVDDAPTALIQTPAEEAAEYDDENEREDYGVGVKHCRGSVGRLVEA
jgi:hypothetical protein